MGLSHVIADDDNCYTLQHIWTLGDSRHQTRGAGGGDEKQQQQRRRQRRWWRRQQQQQQSGAYTSLCHAVTIGCTYMYKFRCIRWLPPLQNIAYFYPVQSALVSQVKSCTCSL